MSEADHGADSLEGALGDMPTVSGDLEADRAREAARHGLFGEGAAVRIGRFTVLERVGAGGMGVVYAAYDPELDRKVALKVLLRDAYGDTDADATPRLLREAQALARISHPNVVAVYEVGTHEDQVFIAMEFVTGTTLGQRQRASSPGWRALLDLYLQAGRGLAAAHAVGLVHRDFKPDNVLVDETGRARVLDFGLARALEAAASREIHETAPSADALAGMLDSPMTRTGAVMGTPAYMSPEQHRGEPADAASDQFSFCVALWEALAGKRPFAGSSLPELVMNVTQARIVDVRVKGVPAALFERLRRGLAEDPRQRFPSMDALLLALERIQRPRVRRLGPLLALSALGLATALVVGANSTGPELCDGASARLGAAWNDERRGAVERALLDTDLPFAPDTAHRVVARLDAYAAQWTSAYEDSCRATHERGEQSDALLDRSMSCLDQRRDRLSATVDRLVEADAQLIERAPELVAKLDPIEQCVDREALLSAVPPPTDAGARAKVSEIRRTLAEARSRREAGAYADADEVVARAVVAGAAVEYPPVAAETGLERGRVLSALGNYADAEPALSDAFWQAVDAGHDASAVDAAIVLASVVGIHGARSEDGMGWVRQAETIARRARAGAESMAAIAQARAGVMDKAGKYAEAVAEYQTVLSAIPEDHPSRYKVFGEMGNAALRAGDFEAARRYQEQAVELARAQLGPDHPEVAATIFNLGAVDYSRGDFERALEAFSRAATFYERVLGPDHPNLGKALNGVGVVLDDLRRYEEAIAAYERSIAILRKVHGDDHPEVAARLDNLALSLANLGRFDEAERTKLRALEILRSSLGPDHPEVGIALHGMAQIEFQRERFDAAIEYDKQALDVWERALGADHPDVATALLSLCSSEIQAGQEREAVPHCARGLEIREAKDVGPLFVAEARLRLGQAMWWGHQDRADARALILRAREGYASDPAGQMQLESLDQSIREMGIALP